MKSAHSSGHIKATIITRITRRCWNNRCHAKRGNTIKRDQRPPIGPWYRW
jgi:hypothetical protein